MEISARAQPGAVGILEELHLTDQELLSLYWEVIKALHSCSLKAQKEPEKFATVEEALSTFAWLGLTAVAKNQAPVHFL